MELSTFYHEHTPKIRGRLLSEIFRKNRSKFTGQDGYQTVVFGITKFSKNDRKIHFPHRSYDTKVSYQVFLVVKCLFISDLLNQSEKNYSDIENNPGHNFATRFSGIRAVGKNEKLESFKFESLKLESF